MNCLLFLETICDSSSSLKIFYFIRELVNLAFLIIPIGSIVILSYDLFKNVISNSENEQKKNFNIFVKRIIFMVVVFLIPYVVGFMIDLVDNALGNAKNSYLKCIKVDMDIIEKQLASEKAKCTSTGNKWNSKTEVCNIEPAVNDTTKKLVKDLKDYNSATLKYRYAANNKYNGSSGDLSSKKYPIAEASLMMALPSEAEARAPSYGSDLYVYIYDHVIEDSSDYRTGKKTEAYNGSTRYRSCSEATAAAVRWSGCDIDFPRNPGAQLNYARSSSKWIQVDWGGDYSKLQPGDIFVDSGHSLMYIGEELLHEYFPKAAANFNITEASYMKNYNRDAQALHIDHKDLNISRWLNNAFRCVNTNYSDKYSNLKLPK